MVMNGTSDRIRGEVGWVLGPAVLVAGLLALVHLAQPLALFLLSLGVLLCLAVLLLMAVVPPLFALGYAVEHALRRMGLHCPDPGALRRRFRHHVILPLLVE